MLSKMNKKKGFELKKTHKIKNDYYNEEKALSSSVKSFMKYFVIQSFLC